MDRRHMHCSPPPLVHVLPDYLYEGERVQSVRMVCKLLGTDMALTPKTNPHGKRPDNNTGTKRTMSRWSSHQPSTAAVMC